MNAIDLKSTFSRSLLVAALVLAATAAQASSVSTVSDAPAAVSPTIVATTSPGLGTLGDWWRRLFG